MKIYTRTGDAGETALFGAGRVAKDDLRVAAYGSVDEANSAIDRLSEGLPELTKFILPAGSRAAAALHLARAVVRRAERETVTLARREALNPHAVVVLNRLSDLLFTLARAANLRSGFEEVTWSARPPA